MEKSDCLHEKYRAMDRRSFLKRTGLLGLGIASTGIIPVVAEAVKFNNKLYKVSETKLAMGTFISITLIHPSRDEAEEAKGQAFKEIKRLTGLMNRFDSATAVGQLNKEGFINELPPELAQVIADSLDYSRISRGTFDITVKPVVDLFKDNFNGKKLTPPSEDKIKQMISRVGSEKIELNGRTVRFKKNGMGITLDGIAKGYIVDRAADILISRNIKNFLINAGGDIRAMGVRADRKPWTVAIEDPQKKRKYPDIIHMTNGAIATSGNYEIYFDYEKMFHHIINPHTGLSPATNTSVSVIAPSTMEADALSTSVFVMEPSQGTMFINSLPGRECLVVSKGRGKYKSAGWKSAA